MSTEQITGQIRVGDINSALVIQLKDAAGNVNIASAETLEIYLKDPSGNVELKDGELYGDGSDGKMKYVTVVGDIDEAGVWTIQGRALWSSGTSKWASTPDDFRVAANLKAFTT